MRKNCTTPFIFPISSNFLTNSNNLITNNNFTPLSKYRIDNGNKNLILQQKKNLLENYKKIVKKKDAETQTEEIFFKMYLSFYNYLY